MYREIQICIQLKRERAVYHKLMRFSTAPPPSVQTNYESPYRKEMSIFRNEFKHFFSL